MRAELIWKDIEAQFISVLEKVPILKHYSRTRGWLYIIAWLHRITGLLLVLYLLFHIYSLSLLYSPDQYQAQMKTYSLAFVLFLEWALAIPVIFHALNGARIILYETYSVRNDESMIRWITALSIIYVSILGMLMLIGTQEVSAIFFWLNIFVIGLVAAYGILLKMKDTYHSIFWKLQRISAAFLMVMVPAHFIFMHLNPSVSKEATMVISRMNSFFIKGVDVFLVVAALYHGAYGLISVLKDYFYPGIVRVSLASFVTLAMLIFAWVGIKLALTI